MLDTGVLRTADGNTVRRAPAARGLGVDVVSGRLGAKARPFGRRAWRAAVLIDSLLA
jgi:hypothetical protein